jgi:hypothetical protein
VTDVATVNDEIAQTVKQSLLTLHNIVIGDDMHINCVALIINLIVQDFLGAMRKVRCVPKMAATSTISSSTRTNHDPLVYSANTDPKLRDLEVNREKDMDGEEER